MSQKWLIKVAFDVYGLAHLPHQGSITAITSTEYLISNQEQSGAKLVEALIMFQNKLALQRRLDKIKSAKKTLKPVLN